MHQDNAINIFTKIFKKVDINWKIFIKDLKLVATPDDQSQIFFQDFLKILDKYGISLSRDEKNSILTSFPGLESINSEDKRINIARIYDQKYNIILAKMYKKVDVTTFEGIDEPEDINGYIGQTKYYRSIKNESPLSEEEFLQIIRD